MKVIYIFLYKILLLERVFFFQKSFLQMIENIVDKSVIVKVKCFGVQIIIYNFVYLSKLFNGFVFQVFYLYRIYYFCILLFYIYIYGKSKSSKMREIKIWKERKQNEWWQKGEMGEGEEEIDRRKFQGLSYRVRCLGGFWFFYLLFGWFLDFYLIIFWSLCVMKFVMVVFIFYKGVLKLCW